MAGAGALADTHAVVWYLFGDPRLSARARDLMEAAVQSGTTIKLASISLAEIVYLVEKNRLPPETFRELCVEIEAPQSPLELLPLDLEVVLALPRVPRSEIPDLPDRVIAATAVAHQLPLITRDQKIRSSSLATVW